jgi:hypothetical protein
LEARVSAAETTAFCSTSPDGFCAKADQESQKALRSVESPASAVSSKRTSTCPRTSLRVFQYPPVVVSPVIWFSMYWS